MSKLSHLSKMISNLYILLLFTSFIAVSISLERVVKMLDGSNNEVTNEYGKCKHGELFDHKTWKAMTFLHLEYDQDVKILCLDVVGKTSTVLGGLMDNKIRLYCQSNKKCEVKVFGQPANQCYTFNNTEKFSWKDKNLLHVNFTDNIITCMEIDGAYQVQSGGIGFTHVTIACFSIGCLAKISKEKTQNCDTGKIVAIAKWTSDLNFLFESKETNILCFEVKGSFKTISGQQLSEKIELKCLSQTCEITLFADVDYDQKCEQTAYNITKKWNRMQPFQLHFNKTMPNEIVCFKVTGRYKLISGGLQQNSLHLHCFLETFCEAVLYLRNPYGWLRRQQLSEIEPVENEHKIDLRAASIKCSNYFRHSKNEWNNSFPLYVSVNHKIMCISGEGKFKIIAGGEGFFSVIANCSSLRCSLEIYIASEISAYSSGDCKSDTLYLTKQFSALFPLVVNLKDVITCYEVKGMYSLISGGVHSKSLVMECTSDEVCSIAVYTDQKLIDNCQNYRMLLKKEWTNFTPLHLHFTNKTKVDCFIIEGEYKVIAGGIGTNSLIIDCFSNNCLVKVYAGLRKPYMIMSQANTCGGIFWKQQCWDKTKPLTIRLNPHQEIVCLNISAGHNVKSGGIGQSFIEIDCLEQTKDCCVAIYVTEVKNIIGGCNYGNYELSKRWEHNKINAIEFEPDIRIVCYNSKGQHHLLSGGIGTNNLKLKCVEPESCAVEVFTVRSKTIRLLSDYIFFVLSISSLIAAYSL